MAVDCPGSKSLLEQNLCHHPLVLMIQQMTVEYRYSLDDRVGKVQDDVDGGGNRNVHRIQPGGIGEWRAILCIGQEVNLMNVERMELGSCVDDTPMLIGTDGSCGHRRCIHGKFAAVDVEAVLVLCECDGEVWRGLLQRFNVDWFVNRRAVVDSVSLISPDVRTELGPGWAGGE